MRKNCRYGVVGRATHLPWLQRMSASAHCTCPLIVCLVQSALCFISVGASGHNGAGKTTLMKEIAAHRIVGMPPDRIARMLGERPLSSSNILQAWSLLKVVFCKHDQPKPHRHLRTLSLLVLTAFCRAEPMEQSECISQGLEVRACGRLEARGDEQELSHSLGPICKQQSAPLNHWPSHRQALEYCIKMAKASGQPFQLSSLQLGQGGSRIWNQLCRCRHQDGESPDRILA